jgi:ankyrin repeat protein
MERNNSSIKAAASASATNTLIHADSHRDRDDLSASATEDLKRIESSSGARASLDEAKSASAEKKIHPIITFPIDKVLLEDGFEEKYKTLMDFMKSEKGIDKSGCVSIYVKSAISARIFLYKIIKAYDAFHLHSGNRCYRNFLDSIDSDDEFFKFEYLELEPFQYNILFEFATYLNPETLLQSDNLGITDGLKDSYFPFEMNTNDLALAKIFHVIFLNKDIKFLAANFDSIIASFLNVIDNTMNKEENDLFVNSFLREDLEAKFPVELPAPEKIKDSITKSQYSEPFINLKESIKFELLNQREFEAYNKFNPIYESILEDNFLLDAVEGGFELDKAVMVIMCNPGISVISEYLTQVKPKINYTSDLFSSVADSFALNGSGIDILGSSYSKISYIIKSISCANPFFAAILALKNPHLDADADYTEQIIDVLIENGADVNYKSVDGITALHIAVAFNLPLVVEKLIKCGADVNAETTCKHITPLHMTIVRNSDNTIVKALIDAGANINKPLDYIHTPVILCFNYQKLEILKTLLDAEGLEHEFSFGSDSKANLISISDLVFSIGYGSLAIKLGSKFKLTKLDNLRFESNIQLSKLNDEQKYLKLMEKFIESLDVADGTFLEKMIILDSLMSSKKIIKNLAYVKITAYKIEFIKANPKESAVLTEEYMQDLYREHNIQKAKILIDAKIDPDAKKVSILSIISYLKDNLMHKSEITFLKEDFTIYFRAFTSDIGAVKDPDFIESNTQKMLELLRLLKTKGELYSPELRLAYALYKSQSDIPFNTIKNLYATVLKYSKEKLFAAKSIEQNKKILSVLNDIAEDLRTTDDIDLIKRIESVQTLENINNQLDVIFDSISRLLNTKNNSGSKKSKQSTKSKDASHESEDTSYKSEVAEYLDSLNKLLHDANNLNTPESFDYVEYKFTSNLMKIYNKLSMHKLVDAISGNFAIRVNKILDKEDTITTKDQSPAHEIDLSEEGFKKFIILYSKNKDHPQIDEILSRLGHIPNLDRRYADKMQTSLANSIGCEIKELSLVKKALNLKIPPEIILSFVNALSNFIPKYSSYLDRVVKDNDKTTIHTYETKEFKDSVKENDSVSKSIIPEDLEDLESEYDNKEFEEEDDIPSPTSQDKGSTSPDTYSHDSNFLDNEDFDDSSTTELANNHVVKLLEILTNAKRVFLKTKHIKYIADHIDNLKFEDKDSGFKLTHLATGKIVGTHREHGKKDYLDLAFINDLLKFFEEVGILEKYLPEEVLEEISQEETDIEFVFGGNLSSEDIIERYLALTRDSSLASNSAAMACSSTSLKYHELDPLGPSVKPLGEAAEAATEIDE